MIEVAIVLLKCGFRVFVYTTPKRLPGGHLWKAPAHLLRFRVYVDVDEMLHVRPGRFAAASTRPLPQAHRLRTIGGGTRLRIVYFALGRCHHDREFVSALSTFSMQDAAIKLCGA